MLLINEYGTIFNLDKIAVIELSDNAKEIIARGDLNQESNEFIPLMDYLTQEAAEKALSELRQKISCRKGAGRFIVKIPS